MTLYFTAPHRMRRHLYSTFCMPATREMVFPLDVKATEDAYIIEAVLPGLEAEDLDIQISNNVLTIKGEIKTTPDDKAVYLLRERPSGSFERSIRLPDDLDAGKTEANLRNGILTLRIAKAEESKPRTINVKAE